MTFFALHRAVEGKKNKTFVKMRSGGQKKQTFCKNAQWRAKKLRERGSSTARPTKKGGGGLPIRSRPVDFGASIRSRPVDFVAICELPLGVSVASCRFRRVDSVASCRFRRVDSVASRRSQGANTKKARFLNRGIGLSYRKASRALNLRLAPLSNTRASARSVRLGLARRFCIVMPTSDRRHIGRCT